ncbi:MAG: Signal peptidase [Planctomycetota bacterium]|jgi:signal peptidase I
MPWDESAQPSAQRWLNTFCENWVFAFLVAMAIRHFCIEAFVIPTASMEPMLYGDPGFLKGDHVVVDKIGHRLRATERWDVTVFQYPQNERYKSTIEMWPAFDAAGRPTQVPFIDPLVHRNFVKRIVGMPGEDWYVRSGNAYVRPAGATAFQVARKPDDKQAVLWQECYRAGAQEGHLPWTGPVEVAGRDLRSPGGDLGFTQPLINLYLKPGRVRFGRLDEREPPVKPDADRPPVSLTEPLITVLGERASVWDLDRWQVRRMNSADLDSKTHGTLLNTVGREPVGDWRWRVQPTTLAATAAWRIRQPGGADYRLELSASGWAVQIDGVVAERRQEPVLGRSWTLAVVDDELQVGADGAILWRRDIAPWADLDRTPLALGIAAGGSWSAAVALDRDLHWSHRFLDGLAPEWESPTGTGLVSYYDWVVAGARETSGLTADLKASGIRQYLAMRLPLLRRLAPALPWPAETDLDRMPLPALLDAMDQARSRARQVAMSPETALPIPADAYLLLGDNSPHSLDGRAWGYVPAANLRGRALAVVLPPSRWRLIR